MYRPRMCLNSFRLELSAYKYAGYGQLIRTIDLEAKNSSLFQEGGGTLLSAAVELANHTLMSSALNAEQLRREQGLEVIFSLKRLWSRF